MKDIHLEGFRHIEVTSFANSHTAAILEKCRRFGDYAEKVRTIGLNQVQYRLELLGPLDHEVLVRDPFSGEPRRMICFDSNSYLGMHLHPAVRASVHKAIDDVGYGTPSAQVLGGTKRYLSALEDELASLHRREAALVFPSGYQANIGILTGLLRRSDAVIHDVFSHASLQDGCHWSGAEVIRYPHNDLEALDRILSVYPGRGRMVVTDGIFSMHGDLAPLPDLIALCRRHDAVLMVDDAHSLGILGANGEGIEEHFGLIGEIKLLMGTFSKAPGSMGGYLVAEKPVVDYLRYISHPALFTASLPAPICAGVTTALRVMREEPEHRHRLWEATRRLWKGLADAGFKLRPLESPIIPVQIGPAELLAPLSVALFEAGIKAGVVQYPAVPRGESILRLSVCSRHTDTEIDRVVEILGEIGRRLDLL
jgi:8-amino-7-oxononanoate synthase